MPRRCYTCGDVGHMKRDCPDNYYESRSCYECGEEGHVRSNCPNKFSYESRSCYKCGEEGHVRSNCPNNFNYESRSCYQCGEEGHVRSNCPNNYESPTCDVCGEEGHDESDCPDVIFQAKQRRRQRRNSLQQYTSPPTPTFTFVPLPKAIAPPPAKAVAPSPPKAVAPPPPKVVVPSPSNAGLPPPPSINGHRIPTHWKISSQYTSFEAAATGLQNEALKFKMFRVDAEEKAEIEQLLRATWKNGVVGIGADARNLGHTSIQVEKVERVENPEMYESYSERKQKLLRRLRAFTPVGRLQGSSGQVLTAEKMDNNSSILRRNIDPKINEYYLFHGTKKEYVNNIARDGMDNRIGSQTALLGPGMYTAESCTKADQYTDAKASRSSGRHRMFLVRVLLGEVYVNSSKHPTKFKRPPCQSCQQDVCNCPHGQQYDSVMDNYHRRLFREFVVYERCQCYPEYLITYRRVGGASATSSVSQPVQNTPNHAVQPAVTATAVPQRVASAQTAPPTAITIPTEEEKCIIL